MSSSRALCSLPSVKKQKKMTSMTSMYNKTIIRFGFCDILNNQGLGKGYDPQPLASLITITSTLIILDITKTSSNNCLLLLHLPR